MPATTRVNASHLTDDMAVTLATRTPCCGRPVRIRAIRVVPRELYDRTCGGCGRAWSVERRTAADTKGIRVDVLTWAAP